MNKTVDGIILAVKDYREYDVILQVLSTDLGLQSFVARGIRKLSSKNAAVCQRFTHARFYIDFKEGQTIHGMRTADLINSFRILKEDLVKQSIASVICDMILSFYNDGEYQIYDDLQFVLDKLNHSKYPYASSSWLLTRLLELQGITPVVDGCVHCGNTSHICAFSPADGGFVCTNCCREDMPKESVTDLKCFRLLVLCDREHYDVLETYADWQFHHFENLYRFFEVYSGIHLKSMKFLRSIENMNQRK